MQLSQRSADMFLRVSSPPGKPIIERYATDIITEKMQMPGAAIRSSSTATAACRASTWRASSSSSANERESTGVHVPNNFKKATCPVRFDFRRPKPMHNCPTRRKKGRGSDPALVLLYQLLKGRMNIKFRDLQITIDASVIALIATIILKTS